MPGTTRYKPYLVLFIIYLFFSIPYSPFFESLGYDKEVFQYIGMIIKNHLHPYSDVFDHKPPIIYLLNYLGVLITANSTWGIFLIMNIIGFSSSIFIYQLATNKFKTALFPIVIATVFICVNNNNSILQGGNLTRQLAAFLITGLIFLVFNFKKTNFTQTLAGILIGIIFFTQQNEILGGLILIAYSVLFEKEFSLYSSKRILKNITFFTIGVLIPTFFILSIIYHWNNYDDFMNQVFLFNFENYLEKKSFIIKITNIIYRFFYILISNKILLVILLITVINLIITIIKEKLEKIDPKLIILVIAFAFQLISSSISGKTYGHYFLMFIPYLTCIFIFSFNKKDYRNINYLSFTLLGVITFFSIKNISYKEPNNILLDMVINQVYSVKNTHGQFYSFNARYLRVNFNLNITSPSEYVYTHFMNEENYKELIIDLKKNNTKYILYSSKSNNFPQELTSFITLNYSEVLNHDGYILCKNNN